MKSQCNSWPCLAIHEKEKAQLVQKNQPNESTVAFSNQQHCNDNSTKEYICVFMYYVLYIILCIAFHKKKNI